MHLCRVLENFDKDEISVYSFQLSFQVWTSQIQETLNCKKRGDAAFRVKDFATAIECYTQVSHHLDAPQPQAAASSL